MAVMKVIYKITYPNGKIYVGKDLTGTLTYFGSPESAVIAQDLQQSSGETLRSASRFFGSLKTLRMAKYIKKQVEFIVSLRSNDPSVGYNRWPKWDVRSLTQGHDLN